MTRIIKNEIRKFIMYIIISLMPLIVLSLVLLAFIGGLVFVYSSIFAQAKEQEIRVSQSNYQSIELKAQDKFIDSNGEKYPLPRFKPDSELEFYALMSVRVSEFGTRQDFSLDGDLDSCSTYQQRISELVTVPYLEAKTKEIIGIENYNRVFTNEVKQMLKNDNYKGRVQVQTTSSYGARFDPITGTNSNHFGLDLGYNYQPVFSPLDGEVTEVIDQLEGGKMIMIKHEKEQIKSLFAHLKEFKVKVGDKVRQGDIIAISGNTGKWTTAQHLHYQVTKNLKGNWNDQTVNPLEFGFTELIKTPFLNICRQLSYYQINNALFDKLFIARMYQEKKELITYKLNSQNLTKFITLLCEVQRPINCQKWQSKAINSLTNWYLSNTFISITK